MLAQCRIVYACVACLASLVQDRRPGPTLQNLSVHFFWAPAVATLRETARPYTDWCEACVAGRGRGIQHRRNRDEKEEVVVQFDCQFWSQDNTEKGDGEPTAEWERRGAQWFLTQVSPRSLGHMCIILQSDS